ncbi:phenylalanine--tRNA ligase subunit beta [Gallaecimonas kandeliae]|uniref:phenylalanine--tRNA ligase subunit beta n=1 Tax=Gallaecimonas kandeliae TaxID=3029055 RepID=UPI002647E3E5|nr:phenylalanine--tRNA ligase subunit beta [Gallaecimonas kandeliae]WKE63950.1 phenylalanine--tRNA ligase subunit beta [Gallaecimonas kandeliae]
MKFSESWLRQWVNPAIDTQTLSEQLSMAGLEVDGIEPVAGSFHTVVVGEVVECAQHPDADKLRVTKVNVGEAELLDIVCGAPNCRQGLKVAVAKVGAVLPGDFTIKKAKLRGQPSHGMLCSFSELGIDIEADGIIELAADAPVGTDVRDYLELNDSTIEVDLTPNRADCLGILGLAREVGVLNNLDVTEVAETVVAPSIDAQRAISLQNPEACPRYLGRVIKGVDVSRPSPLWLTERLRKSGVRSIDAVVDVTNYVLLELGHPLHAFDLAKLDGDIQVRLAKAGEKLTLLDESEVELKDNTLVIADANKALAMAGIFGGLHSGVTAACQDIFLEAAFFAPTAIAGRARQYGLHTDASHRYERGVDPKLTRRAMERATELLLAIVGGEAGPVVEAVSPEHLPVHGEIVLRKARLARVLGAEIADEKVTEILARLGTAPRFDGSAWTVTAPSYRFDIAIEEDLIEEVARVYGYNSIPNKAPLGHLAMNHHREAELSLKRVRSLLVDLGYQEAITYSFVDPKVQQVLFPAEDVMVLPHPISVEMSAMRVSLWPGLLQGVLHNQNRQQGRVRFFESGLRFITRGGELKQQKMLAGVITGSAHGEHWTLEQRTSDFFDLKGDLEQLLALTGALGEFRFERSDLGALHPGQSARILRGDQVVGHFGMLHPAAAKALGLKSQPLVFELQWEMLGDRRIPEAKAVSRFPANRRDLALVVKNEVAAGDILEAVQKIGGNQVVDVNLFDLYCGKGVAEGHKSLAVSLTLQDTARTLEDSEIAEVVNKVVDALKSQFNASLRE